MPNRRLSDEVCIETLEAWRRHGGEGVIGSIKNAADELGIDRRTMGSRLAVAKEREATTDLRPKAAQFELPPEVDDDLPVTELIQLQRKRNRKRIEHRRSARWFPVTVKIDGPIGLTNFGDPHVDDNHCNWDLLWHHCELHRKTDALFGMNGGDTTNNWVGRLMRLFAEQDTSQQTARKYARWLLQDSGVSWMVWLLGNHDVWNEGDAILRAMNGQRITMEKRPFPGTKMVDWQAQFRLVFPNKRECRIWAAHNFPGHSMWNTLHGPQRAAHTKDWAHLYIANHTHNWALHQEESASRNFVYWLARARGYKWEDEHADRHGHGSQDEGAAITAIIDPEATTMAGFVQCFSDMDEAVDFLNFKRKKHGV